jgi:hypothetical protein
MAATGGTNGLGGRAAQDLVKHAGGDQEWWREPWLCYHVKKE